MVHNRWFTWIRYAKNDNDDFLYYDIPAIVAAVIVGILIGLLPTLFVIVFTKKRGNHSLRGKHYYIIGSLLHYDVTAISIVIELSVVELET